MKIKNQLIWKEVEDYVFITLGLMLYAFAFTIFLMPYKIVTGGVTGTAAIVFYATKIPIQDTYMDVGSARRSIVHEHDGERRSCERTSYEERHEVLALA